MDSASRPKEDNCCSDTMAGERWYLWFAFASIKISKLRTSQSSGEQRRGNRISATHTNFGHLLFPHQPLILLFLFPRDHYQLGTPGVTGNSLTAMEYSVANQQIGLWFRELIRVSH